MYTDHAAGVVGHDEEGLDVVVLQVGIALAAVAGLHLVVIAQASQGLLGDVNSSVIQKYHVNELRRFPTYLRDESYTRQETFFFRWNMRQYTIWNIQSIPCKSVLTQQRRHSPCSWRG